MVAASTRHHPPMSATATLTNCYVPLPSSSTNDASIAFDPFARTIDNCNNDDGNNNTLSHQTTSAAVANDDQKSNSSTRGPRTLRQIHLDKSILSQSNGSALVEWGHTKLMVSVRGPRPINCSSLNAANNGGGLVCEGE